MPETKKEKKQETASDTVKTQLAKFSIENAALLSENTRLKDEKTALMQQNIDLANVIENDLKADIIVKIQGASKGRYQRNELQSLNIEQLKNIEEVLQKTGAFESTTTFKSIRAGAAAFDHSARLTVGNLYKNPRGES
jgi:predicted  nucleic acid-binding Zn-ribbon protein